MFIRKYFELSEFQQRVICFLLNLIFALIIYHLAFTSSHAFAQAATHLPGEDAIDKLQAAGTLLRIMDTAMFSWGARFLAAICIGSAGWALKEQRFGVSVICVVSAIIIGTAPTWVNNIFSIGGGGTLFGH